MATASTLAKAAEKSTPRMLQAAEWVAENIYIPWGAHRFFMALGLTSGLWAGRSFMDTVTNRDYQTGKDKESVRVPEILRPLNGLMHYNPYSDEAAERWKYVVDRTVPIATGALGAFLGGAFYFHGKFPGKAPFYGVSAVTKAAAEAKKFSSEVTESVSRLEQASSWRKWGVMTFAQAGSAGNHLFGAFWPFNTGLVAISFQQGAGRNIFLPSFLHPAFEKINQWMGNHGTSSRFLFSAMRDTAKWMETNTLKFAHSGEWATPEALLKRAGDGLQLFPKASAAERQAVANAYRDLIDRGYAAVSNLPQAERSPALYKFLSGENPQNIGLFGQSHDRLLKQAGIDLSHIEFARDPFAFGARRISSQKKSLEFYTQHAEYLNKTFGYKLDPQAWAAAQLADSRSARIATYAGGAALLGSALAGASIAADHINKRLDRAAPVPPLFSKSAPGISADQDPATDTSHLYKPPPRAGMLDWLNGRPLDVMHWAARNVINPISMHRFENAAYFSLFLFTGMKVADVLTGRKLTALTSGPLKNSVLAKEAVWLPLRPLHGLLEYTPGSAAITDRWRAAIHSLIPVTFGAFGTYTGSSMFFRNREHQLEHPKSLEDYAARISFEHSKPFAVFTGLTSIVGTGSGMHLLPFVCYTSHLQNRYLLAADQQIATPIVGRIFNGNPGLNPFGVRRGLQYEANYLGQNPEARLAELPSLLQSTISKLYPQLKDDEVLAKKQIMLQRIYEVRDTFLEDGKVPTKNKPALEAAMKKMMSGEGFEHLLLACGLDPLQAKLNNNGLLGRVANLFVGGRIARLEAQYHQDYIARHAKDDPASSHNFLRALAAPTNTVTQATLADAQPALPAHDGAQPAQADSKREQPGRFAEALNESRRENPRTADTTQPADSYQTRLKQRPPHTAAAGLSA